MRVVYLAPHRGPIGLVWRRDLVPGQDRARQNCIGKDAELLFGMARDANRVLETLGARGALRCVVHLKARVALIIPGDPVVERDLEAHVLLRSIRTDAAAITKGLLDVDDCIETLRLRLEAGATDVLVRCVALSGGDGREGAGGQISEIVG